MLRDDSIKSSTTMSSQLSEISAAMLNSLNNGKAKESRWLNKHNSSSYTFCNLTFYYALKISFTMQAKNKLFTKIIKLYHFNTAFSL